jgi:hypothetical protein
MRARLVAATTLVVLTLTTTANAAPILGQVDDFEDGTTEGWIINLLGLGAPPPATIPTNIPTGGPAGADDNYLQLTSLGTLTAGGRLTAMNPFGQWAGDYLASGITAIEMDVRNLGASDLELRLLFEDPSAGPPTNIAVSSDSILLPAGSGWMHVVFPVTPDALTAVLGDVNTALANTTILRIFHGATATFPGSPIAAQLGVDNITATQLPEPGTLALFAVGAAALARRFSRS